MDPAFRRAHGGPIGKTTQPTRNKIPEIDPDPEGRRMRVSQLAAGIYRQSTEVAAAAG
jgi:hypothetical protein